MCVKQPYTSSCQQTQYIHIHVCETALHLSCQQTQYIHIHVCETALHLQLSTNTIYTYTCV